MAPSPWAPALLLAACASPDAGRAVDLATTAHDPTPRVPRILRDVSMVDDDAQHTHPYVPGHRTTMDGRVALRVQGGTVDLERLSTHLSFFLFVPERLDAPIVASAPGAAILGDAEPFDVLFPPALDPDMFRLGHHAICDPTEPFPVDGEQPNPYPCGPDTSNDCYDLTVISSTSPNVGTQLWGTPVTVEVAAPKTAEAHLVDVRLGEPVAGALIEGSPEWTEPAVTTDGRLMTGRLGRLPRAWTHPETGETFVRPYDLAYAVLPDDADPCDITGWTDFHPMSHAPFDPQMVGRYGLAAYPFRDTEGQPIPDGEDMGGTYPWVDREGANLFMTGVHGRIAEQSTTDYPRRCVSDGCEAYTENIDFDRGFMVAGLWTHGKLVHLDGLINHLDWAVGVSPAAHWWVDLYADDAGDPVPIRVGSGRFIQSLRQEGGPYPPGYTHNPNILDSLQNLANFRPEARPVTPRDVVWVMSSGVATDEIAFDDLLDPNALIVSNMQASITQLVDDDGATLAIPHHHNGQVRVLGGLPGLLATYELEPALRDDVHLQNGATSLHWEVPAYGAIDAGDARVEPVALGGVHGRGLWLSGDAAVRYDLAHQPEADGVPAFVGLFVDPRAPADEARELLRFGDGSGLVLAGDQLVVVRGATVVREVSLPATDGWRHLGLRIAPGHHAVSVLIDGFPLERIQTSEPLFSLGGGTLVVGRDAAPWTGFRGWIDDLVVLLHDVDPEVACNHAGGTLVELLERGPWDATAARYPDWAHGAVADAVGEGSRFACVHDRTQDHAVHVGSPPDGTRSVREAVTFPEGPLRAGAPRPDSSANPFCLTCHTDDGLGGLTVDALRADPETLAEHDRRRQPLQPPRRVFGNVPADWIAPGVPAQAVQAPPAGLLIDPWVLPAPAD